MRRLRPWLYVIVPMLMLVLALILRFHTPWFVEGLQLQVFDTYQRLKPRTYTPVPIKIIDIDDESLERIGQWPWPRTQLAELLERVFDAGALVVAMDVIFAETDRTSPAKVLPIWPSTPAIASLKESLTELPDHDAIFADAIRKTKVVTGFVLTQAQSARIPTQKWTLETVGHDPRPFLPNYQGAVVNLPMIDKAALGNGSFNLIPERDNIVRRMPLMFRIGDIIYPSLAAETLRVAQGESGYVIKAVGTEQEPTFGGHTGITAVAVGALAVPTDAQGRIWLHYTEFEPNRYVPAWKLLDKKFDASQIEGYVLLLGATAAGLKDAQATPLNPTVAGAEIHAAVIEQILLGHFLKRPDWADGAELIYLVVLGVALILLLSKLRALWCAALGAGVVVLAVSASWYAYAELNYLLDPVGPSLEVLLIYLAGSLINFVQTEAERRQVRNAFNHYLAPSVIEQLLADPDRLVLGGEKRETTHLFTDLAGFTSLTERIEPTVLVRLLNEYLDETSSIVLQHGGTIDKIVGDALHVMFNAPSEQPDHAERAVVCAMELDRFCQNFRSKQVAQGIDLGETRIGVNTGSVVVGNFGGTARFDYTAHGDAINTAARLEGANKYLGTRICVSGTTATECPAIHFRPIGRLVLKGKAEGIEVYEPLPHGEAGYEKTENYLGAYRLLEKADPNAAQAFHHLAQQFPEDNLIAFHAKRLVAGTPRRAGEYANLIVMRDK